MLYSLGMTRNLGTISKAGSAFPEIIVRETGGSAHFPEFTIYGKPISDNPLVGSYVLLRVVCEWDVETEGQLLAEALSMIAERISGAGDEPEAEEERIVAEPVFP